MASETRSRRREILSQHWTADAKYVDPLMSGDGLEGVDALIADVQQRFPDFRFKLIGENAMLSIFTRSNPQPLREPGDVMEILKLAA